VGAAKLVGQFGCTGVILGMTKIAIFASGMGSNAARIIDHFRHDASVMVALIACNKTGAGVLDIAKREGIPTLLLEKEVFFQGGAYVEMLRQQKIGFIVLAGFLWKVPPALIQAYPEKIINIHPALLPKHGGKGMYGRYVHEAVIAEGEKETGITIHYVDELYDHGRILFQTTVPVEAADTAATIAEKVHQLEYAHFAGIIGKVIRESLHLQNHR
jgi:formyltetrahydrofolate-dependent phosphoribosylglycinamide formyltransferase